MDLKQYFKKIRDVESSLEDEYPIIVSLETADGGKAGVLVEVSRWQGAKALVESRAVLANEAQKAAYFEAEASRKKTAEKAELSRRVQIAIISDSDIENLRLASRNGEDPKEPR